MDGDRDVDVVDGLLKKTAPWEPPDGFALRVIAAARSDVRRASTQAATRPRLGVFTRLRVYAAALAMRRESTLWVLRQYWNLLRVR